MTTPRVYTAQEIKDSKVMVMSAQFVRISDYEAALKEQCHINAISAERELKLQVWNSKLADENADLNIELEKLRNELAKGQNGG